eukprot:CAMPEP_0205812118 /NCGR_PEP_ID=MMETSP0205-20121125/16481_1 /ASSEMBLY_ACC=CAM_ASM_000278 /TAXON_ID=36767 /ORGANISM="Euplotes focardii, Strain TN1" /LENGTH=62 /DNA_ID=CAMNT_0053092295 /DNA_START=220 /DNA_END=408 /DNA_ORIENTATION=+
MVEPGFNVDGSISFSGAPVQSTQAVTKTKINNALGQIEAKPVKFLSPNHAFQNFGNMKNLLN